MQFEARDAWFRVAVSRLVSLSLRFLSRLARLSVRLSCLVFSSLATIEGGRVAILSYFLSTLEKSSCLCNVLAQSLLLLLLLCCYFLFLKL